MSFDRFAINICGTGVFCFLVHSKLDTFCMQLSANREAKGKLPPLDLLHIKERNVAKGATLFASRLRIIPIRGLATSPSLVANSRLKKKKRVDGFEECPSNDLESLSRGLVDFRLHGMASLAFCSRRLSGPRTVSPNVSI